MKNAIQDPKTYTKRKKLYIIIYLLFDTQKKKKKRETNNSFIPVKGSMTHLQNIVGGLEKK